MTLLKESNKNTKNLDDLKKEMDKLIVNDRKI
jgi:hypothetical protein